MWHRPITLQDSLYKVNLCQDLQSFGTSAFVWIHRCYTAYWALSPSMWNESRLCCHRGIGEEREPVCSTGTAHGLVSLLLPDKTGGSWLPKTICIAPCQRASQKHVITPVMSLQNHICEAWRMFLFPNASYWVILFMWDRLYSLPRELLWITITTR